MKTWKWLNEKWFLAFDFSHPERWKRESLADLEFLGGQSLIT
jgi:hypothetical protein